MGEHVIKLPDVGEGVAEAELVEWHVKVGDLVREDMVLAAVMTDKATVEIPSPVDGEILWLGAELGDPGAIASLIVRLKVRGGRDVAQPARPAEPCDPDDTTHNHATAMPARTRSRSGDCRRNSASWSARPPPRPWAWCPASSRSVARASTSR